MKSSYLFVRFVFHVDDFRHGGSEAVFAVGLVWSGFFFDLLGFEVEFAFEILCAVYLDSLKSDVFGESLLGFLFFNSYGRFFSNVLSIFFSFSNIMTLIRLS